MQLGPTYPEYSQSNFSYCMDEWNNQTNSQYLYAENYRQDILINDITGDILAQPTTNTVSSSNGGSFTLKWVSSY